MAELLTCPRGHQWNAVDERSPKGTVRIGCPTCGAEAVMTLPHANQEDGPTLPPRQPPQSAEQPMRAPAGLPEVFGRHRVQRVLGEGGMGAVYLAHDTQLDRPVALKVPRFDPDDGPEVLERFFREARSAATVSHANICPVHDIGQINGIHFLTMAYLDGETLWSRIANGKPMPPRQAAALVRKLALALEEAHQRGIIHRDLKPANVMMTRNNEPIIMDFGLARRLNDQEKRLTKTGEVVGTIIYMSPEQVMGEQAAIGPASDIYSLGVMLYELLTARAPFEGLPAAIVTQIVTTKPPPMSSFVPGISPRLEEICARALQKEIKDRFPSMKAFAAALTEYLKTESPTVIEVPPSVGAAPAPERDAADQESIGGLRPSMFGGLRSVANMAIPSVQPRKPKAAADAKGSPRPKARARRARKTAWVWLVGGIAVIGVMAAALRFIASPAAVGRLVFVQQASWATDLKVTVDGVRVDDLDLPLPLAPGDHDVEMTAGNAKPAKRTVHIASGETAKLSILLDRLEVELPKPSEPPVITHKPPDTAPAPPVAKLDLRLEPSAITLEGGNKTAVTIHVDRHGRSGPIAVQAEGLPRGVSAKVLTIPPQSSRGELELSADVNLDPADLPIKVVASLAELREQQDLHLTIRRGDLVKIIQMASHTEPIFTCAFSGDGKFILAGGGGKLNEERKWVPGADHGIHMWNLHTGLDTNQLKLHTNRVVRIASSLDGRAALTSSWDKMLALWDLQKGLPVGTPVPMPQGKVATGLALSPNHRRALVGGGEDIWLVNLEIAKEIRHWPANTGVVVEAMAFSPDGRRGLAGSNDGKIYLLDLNETPRTTPKPQMLDGLTEAVWSLAFSPSGQLAAAGSGNLPRATPKGEQRKGDLVSVWDLSSGKLKWTGAGHKLDIKCVAFSADGRYLLSGSRDKTVRLWDVATGKELRVYQGHANPVQAVGFSTDGQFALSASFDKTIRMWRLP